VLPGPIGSLGAGVAERLRHYRRRSGVADGAGGPAGSREGAGSAAPDYGDDPASSDVVVAASGNLALVALPKFPGQASRDEIDRRHPSLLDALVRHPGVAIVVVRAAGGPVAIGRGGTHDLAEGRIEGEDPLLPFGGGAAESLRRLAGFKDSGDIILLGSVDATGAVVTFEELVGSHGGLGGWQARDEHATGGPEPVGVAFERFHHRLHHQTRHLERIDVLGVEAVHEQAHGRAGLERTRVLRERGRLDVERLETRRDGVGQQAGRRLAVDDRRQAEYPARRQHVANRRHHIAVHAPTSPRPGSCRTRSAGPQSESR
jgi:hypothetical protein